MRTILFIAAILCSFTAGAQRLEISHLTGNCYTFITYGDYNGTPYPANGMYLLTDQGAVLFDTPWDTTQCQHCWIA